MMNLIPLEEKKKHLTEYRLRLGVVMLFAAVTLVGSSLILLSPSYVLAIIKANFIENEVARLESKVKRAAQEKEIDAQIKDINRKVDIYLKLGKSGRLHVSEIVAKIAAIRPDTIKIVSIVYDPGAGERVVLVGTARDRESLALFLEALRKDGTWGNINLPISSYVKSKDIGFSIVLDRATTVVKK